MARRDSEGTNYAATEAREPVDFRNLRGPEDFHELESEEKAEVLEDAADELRKLEMPLMADIAGSRAEQERAGIDWRALGHDSPGRAAEEHDKTSFALVEAAQNSGPDDGDVYEKAVRLEGLARQYQEDRASYIYEGQDPDMTYAGLQDEIADYLEPLVRAKQERDNQLYRSLQ